MLSMYVDTLVMGQCGDQARDMHWKGSYSKSMEW